MQIEKSHLIALRDKFRTSCGSNNSNLEKILMVGAEGRVTGNGTLDRLSDNDQYHLKYSLKTLADEGISVTPNFDVEIMNKFTQYGQEDFLTSKTDAQIIIFTYIFALHENSNQWREALEKTPAKYAISANDETTMEIGPIHLTRQGQNGFMLKATNTKNCYYYNLMERSPV